MLLVLMRNETLNDSIDDLVYTSQTEDIIYNLYQFNQPITTVIVTKEYIDYVGYNKVSRALKALNFLRPIKIIYLSYESTLDLFIKQMHDMNLVTIQAKLNEIDKSYLEKLINKSMDYNLSNVSAELSNKISEITHAYKRSSDKEGFMSLNHEDIIRCIDYTIMLSNEFKIVQSLNKQYEKDIEILRRYNNKCTKNNIDLSKQNIELKFYNKQWFNLFNENQDLINQYNENYVNRFQVENDNEYLHIFYFKEIDDINFTRFFNELYEKFSLYKNTKALIIDNNRHRNYDNLGFTEIPDSIEVKELVKMKKMVRYSEPKSVLSKLCAKSFKSEVLLIFDRTSNVQPFIPNSNIFYLGNYREQYRNIEISDRSFISPYEGYWNELKPLFIPIQSNEILPLAYETVSRNNIFTYYLEDLIERSKLENEED